MLMVGAGEGTLTPGLFLGKEALYQLSYTRMCVGLLMCVRFCLQNA